MSRSLLADPQTVPFQENKFHGTFEHGLINICHLELEISLVFSKDFTAASMPTDKLCQKAAGDQLF